VLSFTKARRTKHPIKDFFELLSVHGCLGLYVSSEVL
jgi:hypothetical protein